MGTGLSLQQSGPPGPAVTVLSAGGERPWQGRAWGLLHPHFPASGTQTLPLPGLGTASSPGDSASSTGGQGPRSWREGGEDGVSRGPAEGIRAAWPFQHPAAGAAVPRLPLG